jgi:hypothetical protein
VVQQAVSTGFRYPKDRFEHLLETVEEKYGPQAAEEIRALYDFLRRKEALDGLKTESETAAILYYAAKKLGLRYDYVRPRRSSARTPRQWRKT